MDEKNDLTHDNKENIILCSKCNNSIPTNASFCPTCGYNMSSTNANSLEPVNLQTVDNVKDGNKTFMKKYGRVAILGIVILAAIIIFSNTLTGNNKIAYERVLKASSSFKDPSSVRLTSGYYTSFDDTLACGISATNGYGARTTSYYDISESGYASEVSFPILHDDTDELNIKLINKKLEKKLKKY